MNRQQQVNTFSGGLNMDVDYSLLKDSQYIYAENLRVVANEGSDFGVAQTIEGFEQCDTLVGIGDGETIIHTDIIRDYGIVFTVDAEGINHIYRFDFTKSVLNPEVRKVISGPLDIHSPVSSVCRWESKDYVKIYWADGEHQIRVANIAPSMDEFNSTININTLNMVPDSNLPMPEFNGFGSGALKMGKIQYCYQLFSVRGSETSVSPLSALIRLSRNDVGNTEVIGTEQGDTSGKSVSIKADFDDTNTFTHARIISIHYSGNNEMPTIKIVDEVALANGRLRYTDNGTGTISELTLDEFNALISYIFIPKVLETKDNILFAANLREDTWDVEYDARAYRADDTGMVTLMSASEDPKTFHLSDIRETAIDATHDAINPTNTADVLLHKYGITQTGELVLGGTGVNVSYRFVITDLVEDSARAQAGLLPNTGRTITSLETDLDSLDLMHIEGTYAGSLDLPAHSVKTLSYGDPTIDSLVRGYHRDEVYRFAVVFYNEQNVASSAHWIGDIRMPESRESEIFSSGVNVILPNGEQHSQMALVTHPMGLSFEIRNIPEGVTGVEIVRCDRTLADRSIVMQGAVSRIGMYQDTTGSILRPYQYLTYSTPHRSGYITHTSINTTETLDTHFFNFIQDVLGEVHRVSPNDMFLFVSPEAGVNRENVNVALSDVTSIKEVCRAFSRIESESNQHLRTFVNLSSLQTPNCGDGLIYTTERPDFGEAKLVLLASNSDDDDLRSATKESQTIAKYYNSTHVPFRAVSEVKSTQYIDPLDWNQFLKEDLVTHSTPVEGYQFNNTSGTLWNVDLGVLGEIFDADKYLKGHKEGLGGPSVVFKAENMTNDIYLNDATGVIGDAYLKYAPTSIVLCNFKQSSAMYGGITYSSRQNSTYMSIGLYSKVENQSANILGFGGDTYITVYDYLHNATYYKEDDYEYARNWKNVHSAYIPCESTINCLMMHDSIKASRTYNRDMQNNISVIGNMYTQNKPRYAYADVYSADSSVKIYVSKGLYNIDDLESDARVIHSQPKTNNEVSDSWTKFKVANYLDVDNQYGSINRMLTFGNNLFFWQTDAFGTLAVNERSLIQDNNPGALTLGTGDILTRYDYATTKNGLKPDYLRSVTNSDSTVYWYDHDRVELCGFNGQLQAVSKLKGVQTYLVQNNASFNVNPNAVYDKKYNEVLLTLDDNTLVFSEQIGAFTSFNTYHPDWYFEFSDNLYTFKGLTLYKYNSGVEKDLYDEDAKVTTLRFVVNKDYTQTKTFDNVQYGADVTWGTNLDDIKFETKRQTSFITKSNQIDYREDTYKFVIPRSDREFNEIQELVNKSYRDRMKGKYLISTYHYDNNNGKQFKLPYINTYYRYSFI